MPLSLADILSKRFNYNETVDTKEFTNFCNEYFDAEKCAIIKEYFAGNSIDVLVHVHHMASSRIHNLAYLAVDRYFNLKLKGANNEA